jgi:hypothetical protein
MGCRAILLYLWKAIVCVTSVKAEIALMNMSKVSKELQGRVKNCELTIIVCYVPFF